MGETEENENVGTDSENIQTDIAADSETADIQSEPEQQPVREPKRKTRYTKQEKKLVRRKASKSDQSSSLSTTLRLAVESGKVEFGSHNAIKDSQSGNTKMLIIAKNAPMQLKETIQRNSALSSLPVIDFEGTSIELGSVCGKPYPVAVLSIHEQGSSTILDFVKGKKV